MIRLPLELSTTSFIDHIPTGFELRMITDDETEVPVNSAQMLMHTNTFADIPAICRNSHVAELNLAVYADINKITPLCIPWLIEHMHWVHYRSAKGTIRDTPFETVEYDTIVNIPIDVLKLITPMMDRYGLLFKYATDDKNAIRSIGRLPCKDGGYICLCAKDGANSVYLLPTFIDARHGCDLFTNYERKYDNDFRYTLDKIIEPSACYTAFKDAVRSFARQRDTTRRDPHIHIRIPDRAKIAAHKKRMLNIYEETPLIVMNSTKLYDRNMLCTRVTNDQERKIENYPLCVQVSMEYELLPVIEEKPVPERGEPVIHRYNPSMRWRL